MECLRLLILTSLSRKSKISKKYFSYLKAESFPKRIVIAHVKGFLILLTFMDMAADFVSKVKKH